MNLIRLRLVITVCSENTITNIFTNFIVLLNNILTIFIVSHYVFSFAKQSGTPCD